MRKLALVGDAPDLVSRARVMRVIPCPTATMLPRSILSGTTDPAATALATRSPDAYAVVSFGRAKLAERLLIWNDMAASGADDEAEGTGHGAGRPGRRQRDHVVLADVGDIGGVDVGAEQRSGR